MPQTTTGRPVLTISTLSHCDALVMTLARSTSNMAAVAGLPTEPPSRPKVSRKWRRPDGRAFRRGQSPRARRNSSSTISSTPQCLSSRAARLVRLSTVPLLRAGSPNARSKSAASRSRVSPRRGAGLGEIGPAPGIGLQGDRRATEHGYARGIVSSARAPRVRPRVRSLTRPKVLTISDFSSV